MPSAVMGIPRRTNGNADVFNSNQPFCGVIVAVAGLIPFDPVDLMGMVSGADAGVLDREVDRLNGERGI